MHLPHYHRGHYDAIGHYHHAHTTYNDGPIWYPPGPQPAGTATFGGGKSGRLDAIVHASGAACLSLWLFHLFDLVVDGLVLTSFVLAVRYMTMLVDSNSTEWDCALDGQVIASGLLVPTMAFPVVLILVWTVCIVVVMLVDLFVDRSPVEVVQIVPSCRIAFAVVLIPSRLLLLIAAITTTAMRIFLQSPECRCGTWNSVCPPGTNPARTLEESGDSLHGVLVAVAVAIPIYVVGVICVMMWAGTTAQQNVVLSNTERGTDDEASEDRSLLGRS